MMVVRVARDIARNCGCSLWKASLRYVQVSKFRVSEYPVGLSRKDNSLNWKVRYGTPYIEFLGNVNHGCETCD